MKRCWPTPLGSSHSRPRHKHVEPRPRDRREVGAWPEHVNFFLADGFFSSRRVQIATLAARERMPASYASREMVEAGLLMGYGTNIADMFRQVGIYTGSILQGARPADLPVIQATKFEFIINLQTAKSLGLDISPMLLARADEVIE